MRETRTPTSDHSDSGFPGRPVYHSDITAYVSLVIFELTWTSVSVTGP